MVMRYSHLSPEHKAAAVALLNDLEKGSGDVVELPRAMNKCSTSAQNESEEICELQRRCNLLFFNGAEDETRTRTRFPPLPPQSGIGQNQQYRTKQVNKKVLDFMRK